MHNYKIKIRETRHLVMALAFVLFPATFLFSQINEFNTAPQNNWETLCQGQGFYEPCINLVDNGTFNNFYPGNGPVQHPFHNIGAFCPWSMALITPNEATSNNLHHGTPNGFHQSINNISNEVPTNDFGTQTDEAQSPSCSYYEEADISAYAGIYTWMDSLKILPWDTLHIHNYREYIQQPMLAPLVAGKKYSVSIKVSLAETSAKATPMSIMFTAQRPAFETYGIVYPTGYMLQIPTTTIKNGWATYTYSFTYTGPDARYITIGNFQYDTEIPLTAVPGGITDSAAFSYYYIDDIAVYEVDAPCCPSFYDDWPCATANNDTPLPIVSGPTGPCVSGTYSITNSSVYAAGSIFGWTYQAGNGTTLSGNGTSTTLSLAQTSAGGTLTFTVQAPYGCPKTAQVAIMGCCLPPNGNPATTFFAAGGPTTNKASQLINYFGGNPILTGKTVVINGTFTIDANMTWTNVTAIFGENAKVVMDNQKTFTVRGSHLYACNKMWQGIEVDHPSEVVKITTSKLEDAIVGISTANGAPIEVGGNTFNRNQTHIALKNFSGIYPAQIFNNQFTCDNNAGQLQTLKAPNNTSYTLYGIYGFFAGQVNVGDNITQNFNGNTFRNAEVHINGVSTGFTVKKATFGSMLNWTAPTIASGGLINSTKGIGIRIYAPTSASTLALNVGGSAVEACTFTGYDNKGAGIFTNGNIHVTAKYNTFQTLKYGAVVQQLTGYTTPLSNGSSLSVPMNLSVENNSFSSIDSCGVYGVAYLRAKVNVKTNAMINTKTKGVYFGNVTSPKDVEYNIMSNNISGLNFIAGVHLMGCTRAKVQSNIMNFTGSATSMFATGSSIRYGIRAEGCIAVDISSNIIQRTNTINIFTPATFNKLQGINVAASQNAMVCQNTCKYLGIGMHFMLNNSGCRIRKNIMHYDHTGVFLTNATIKPPVTDGTEPWENEWYMIYGNDINKRITGTATGGNFWRWRSNAGANKNPNLPIVVASPAFQWPSSNPGGTVTCIGNTAAGVIGNNSREAAFGSTVDGTIVYDEESAESMKLMDEKSAYLSLVDDSALWATDDEEDDKFRSFVSEKELSALGNLKAVNVKEREGDKEGAMFAASSMNATTSVEEYEKTVNEIYIRRWMKDTLSFDSTEIEQLSFIANLSYDEGGSAVIGARVLLGGNFVELESKNTILDEEKTATENVIVVYPNPNYGYINFKVVDAKTSFVFELYSIDGSKVYSAKMNADNIPQGIDVKNLSNGSYIYKITRADGKIENGKLVLTK